ncbi:MAG: 4Fe-4S binding protein, partial [Fidelibacterota bacterium]
MYSLKFAHLVKEKVNARVYEFYIDMRTAGKGYEEFYKRVLMEDVIFIRGKGAEITDISDSPEEEGKLIVKCEETLLGIVRSIPVDMVILSAALQPGKDMERIAKIFSCSRSKDGFFLEKHLKLAPVLTATDGIFVAGACQSPKDIPDSVAQGGAAASNVIALVDIGTVQLEPTTAFVDEDVCTGCRTCIPLCPYEAISRDDDKKIAVINEALCKGCGTCVAACPGGAARQNGFEDEQIFAEIEALLAA